MVVAKKKCGAKPGNKHALGNAGGAPPKYDLKKEAEDLLAWSELDDSISIYGFVNPKPYIAQQLTEFCARSEEFSLALIKAKQRIAERRERKVHEGKFHFGVYGRSAGVYDKMLVDHEDAQRKKEREEELKMKKALLEHEAKLKASAEANKQVSPNESVLNELLQALKPQDKND